MSDCFRYDLIPAGARVLCALSGGADSMYLLCRLLEGAERGNYTVCAAHFNHGLRPTAGRDEDFARMWCAKQGVPLAVGRGDVRAFAARQGHSVEEGARVLRYSFLEETAARGDCALIATGHHAGDNAETVLMNLIRGSGLKGLTGIPERRGNIIRPMLAVSRADIEHYLAANGIPHVEDESNGDQSYTRNKIRHRLIPLLEELNPRAAEHICAAAARLREDEAELSRQGAALAAGAEEGSDGLSIPAGLLAGAPRAIALRALALLTERAGSAADAGQLEGLLALAAGDDPSARLDLPGGCTARREYDRLVFGARPAEPPAPMKLTAGQFRWGDWRLTCTPAVSPPKPYVDRTEFFLRPALYTVRSRREGDEVRLGLRPTKTVKKLMIEEKVPAARRERIPVLAHSDGCAAALGGFGPDARYLAHPGQSALHIVLREEKEL